MSAWLCGRAQAATAVFWVSAVLALQYLLLALTLQLSSSSSSAAPLHLQACVPPHSAELSSRLLAQEAGTLGLLGARGSSSQGFTMATLRPRSSRKKYVPPRPSRQAVGSCHQLIGQQAVHQGRR